MSKLINKKKYEQMNKWVTFRARKNTGNRTLLWIIFKKNQYNYQRKCINKCSLCDSIRKKLVRSTELLIEEQQRPK